MKQHKLVIACAAALSVPLAYLSLFAGSTIAQQAPALPPPLVQPPANINSASAFTLSGPASPELVESADEVPLGRAFEKQSVGISFNPPESCKLTDSMGTSKYLAEWSDTDRDWTLKLGKMILDSEEESAKDREKKKPATVERQAPLTTTKDNFNDKVIEGILDKTVKNLKASLPGSKLLRQDVTNTRDSLHIDPRHPESRNNVGLIAIRYAVEGKHKLSQQAIIQAAGGVYYLLTLTTPGSKASLDGAQGDAPDPAEIVAVNTFTRMIDSIRLLDQKAIAEDQVDRLYHSRLAILGWTPEKLHKVILNEQWLRIVKDGKDIGYSYVTEDQAGGIPRPLKREELIAAQKAGDNEAEQKLRPKGDGILVGIRAGTTTTGMRSNKTKGLIQIDSSSWAYISADKKHEDFSRVVVTDDHIAPKKGYVQEFGLSDKRDRRMVLQADDEKANDPKADRNAINLPDRNKGQLVFKEDWELDVTLASNSGNAEPLMRKLPPWYLPQALSHLLPRLLPLDRPQKYLFASYVSDAREVVMRYLDVLPEQTIVFNGQPMRAVPIKDRLGLQGSVTVHYMSVDGNYIGSENKEQKLVLLPTNDITIKHIWAEANLSRPDGIDRNAPANASR